MNRTGWLLQAVQRKDDGITVVMGHTDHRDPLYFTTHDMGDAVAWAMLRRIGEKTFRKKTASSSSEGLYRR